MLYINNSPHLAQKYAGIFVGRYYLFWDANRFPWGKLPKTASFEGQIMSKDKYIHVRANYHIKWKLLFRILNVFLKRGGEKCLWIAYGLLLGMYTSLCSLVWLYEQTNMSLLLSQLLNSYPSWIIFETIAFILPDVRFENWVISLVISPRIFSRFSWGGRYIRSRDELWPLACEQIYSMDYDLIYHMTGRAPGAQSHRKP